MATISRKPTPLFSEVIHKLFSTSKTELLQNRIYKTGSLIALTASSLALAFNLLIDLAPLLNLTLLFIVLSYAFFYYNAQFKNQYFKNTFVLISQFGLALTWYSESGLSGPVLPLFIIAVIVFTAVADAKYHIHYLLITIANIIGLFLLEQSDIGSSIYQYPSKLSHDIDISFTLIISSISIFILVNYIKKIFIENYEITLKQKNELETLNRTKDKFFSIIAHDLRGPFNGMIELTKLMSDESIGLGKNELQELSAKLNVSAKNTYNLLENLLNWAKMNQGMIVYKPQIIKLKEFASIHLATMQDMANRKTIITSNNIPEDITVFADEYMLQTIIRNLIHNAIKFTKSGGLVQINVGITNDNMVEISVKDNGVGMTTETLNNIFSIEQKIGKAGTENESSTGLGLLLCHEFAIQHQSIIKVESEIGKGSAFKFTLPLSK